MQKGVDCGTPLTAKTAAAIKAAGYSFVGRYLVPASGSTKWKALTKHEAEVITNAGLKLLCVYETTTDRAKGGASAGASDGATAYALAKQIGMPCGGIIYFAVDYDVPRDDMAAISAYLKAARMQTEEYEIGVYGGFRVIEAIKSLGVCKGFWQCVAWSYGSKSAALTVYQSEWSGGPEAKRTAALLGHSVDINECPDTDKAGIWDYEEDNMNGEEIFKKLNDFLATQPLPEWARDELAEAVDMGITDGTRPMQLIPRYQAAIMAKRAAKAVEDDLK